MPLKIVRNDITKMKADAIVNTANPKPIYASGTDFAIYQAAGAKKLLAARKKIGVMEVGEVAITPAFALNAKYIIHTVGPIWQDGKHEETKFIRKCYRNSLLLATKRHCKSIAFPLISTGAYGCPKEKVLQLAISIIKKFLLTSEMMVYLVVFDREAFRISNRLFKEVDSYIKANYVKEKIKLEYGNLPITRNIQQISDEVIAHREQNLHFLLGAAATLGNLIIPKRNLDDVMNQLGETFQERLFRFIDERGLTDVEVYKKANLSRKLFSKIRCNKDYTPTKKTVLALAIALELNIDDTKDLLQSAGLALSPSSKFDLIIEYFIEYQVYDVYTINIALNDHDQPTLDE